MPDPTIVVSYSSGYYNYRLSVEKDDKVVIEESSCQDCETGVFGPWREVKRFNTTGEAWDFIGKELGWK